MAEAGPSFPAIPKKLKKKKKKREKQKINQKRTYAEGELLAGYETLLCINHSAVRMDPETALIAGRFQDAVLDPAVFSSVPVESLHLIAVKI